MLWSSALLLSVVQSVTFVDIISYLLDRNILLNSYFVNRNYVFMAIHKLTAVQKKDAAHLHLDEVDLVAVLLQQFYNVSCIDEYGRCVVARMDAHDLVLVVLVEEDDDILFFIIEYAERCNSAAVESKLGHQVIL